MKHTLLHSLLVVTHKHFASVPCFAVVLLARTPSSPSSNAPHVQTRAGSKLTLMMCSVDSRASIWTWIHLLSIHVWPGVLKSDLMSSTTARRPSDFTAPCIEFTSYCRWFELSCEGTIMISVFCIWSACLRLSRKSKWPGKRASVQVNELLFSFFSIWCALLQLTITPPGKIAKRLIAAIKKRHVVASPVTRWH